MDNKEKITEVLRRSPLTPLTYSDIKATAGVPVGSFDRTLAALVGDGTVFKTGDGYWLAGDGSAIEYEEPAWGATFSCIARAAMGRTRARTRGAGRRWRTSTGGPSNLNIGGMGPLPPTPQKTNCTDSFCWSHEGEHYAQAQGTMRQRPEETKGRT